MGPCMCAFAYQHVYVCNHDDVCICMHKACVYVYNHSHNNHIFFSFYKVALLTSLITYLHQTNIVLLFTQPILHTYTIGWGVPHHFPMQLHTPFSFTPYLHPHTPMQMHTLINDPSHRMERILIFCSIHPLRIQLSAYT